jgi:hypothetical protein
MSIEILSFVGTFVDVMPSYKLEESSSSMIFNLQLAL